jgi:8-oxo-dGTP diphosphatase
MDGNNPDIGNKNQFLTVRVYGILIKENSVLLSDEYHHGREITKFPGGGLQQGEGTIDCLIREFREEMNITIRVRNHLYTTDFYQQSAFDPNIQVIGIYYFVDTDESDKIIASNISFDFSNRTDGAQSLRWKKLDDLTTDLLTFPTDKKATELLINNLKLNS